MSDFTVYDSIHKLIALLGLPDSCTIQDILINSCKYIEKKEKEDVRDREHYEGI